MRWYKKSCSWWSDVVEQGSCIFDVVVVSGEGCEGGGGGSRMGVVTPQRLGSSTTGGGWEGRVVADANENNRSPPRGRDRKGWTGIVLSLWRGVRGRGLLSLV